MKRLLIILTIGLLTLTSCEVEPLPIPETCTCMYLGEENGSLSYISYLEIKDCSRDGELKWYWNTLTPQYFELTCQEGDNFDIHRYLDD